MRADHTFQDTRVMQPSGMPSVMHTADHSHKMRKIYSDAQLINDGGSVNMYIVPNKKALTLPRMFQSP